MLSCLIFFSNSIEICNYVEPFRTGTSLAVHKSSRKRETPQPADNLPAEARSIEPEPEHDYPSPALPSNSRGLTVAFLLSKVSASTVFAFCLSFICTPSWQQLQHFHLLLATFVNILKTCKEMIWLWKASILYALVLIENRSTVSHRLVTAQLQPVTDHSPTSRRLVSTDRKPIALRMVNSCRLVSNQSLTSCKTYHRLIGDHKLIPDIGITVSVIASQLQWNWSQTGCITVKTYVWLMLYKVDNITSTKREWYIYLQLTNKPWFITKKFTH